MPSCASVVNVAAVEQQLTIGTSAGTATEVRIGNRHAARDGAGDGRDALHVNKVFGRVDADRRLTLVVAQDELAPGSPSRRLLR